MPEAAKPRWVLLIHQIPPKPDYFRVKVLRRLQHLGAVAIRNSVYVLPRSDETFEDFQWQMREITADGGEASVCEANFADGLSDTEIESLFRAAREADYRGFMRELRRLPKRNKRTGSSKRFASDVARLKRRLAEIVAIDFFGAPSRSVAHEALARVEERFRPATAPAPESSAPTRSPQGATWITRKGIHVDRIASAWLIRRFIDAEAHFKFVDPEGYRPRSRGGELRFDMFEAEYTHEGENCTFETLLSRFRLGDPALRVIAEIVHDIDCKEAKFGRPETPGVERLIAGIAKQHAADTARLEYGLVLWDALYTSLLEAAKEPRRSHPAKRSARQ